MEGFHACLLGECCILPIEVVQLMALGLLWRNALWHGLGYHWWCAHHACFQKVHICIYLVVI